MAKKKLTFEEGIQELETIVRSLETGNMPLEESFKAFERATQLQEQLKSMLDEGNKRIRLLTENNTEVDFAEDSEE